VVGGKILETLELARFLSARDSVLDPRKGRIGRTQRVRGPGAASVVRLSRIDDYLADNLCVPMLSEVMRWVQEKSGRAAGRFPNWELFSRLALR
jgi:hypothetical protein